MSKAKRNKKMSITIKFILRKYGHLACDCEIIKTGKTLNICRIGPGGYSRYFFETILSPTVDIDRELNMAFSEYTNKTKEETDNVTN